MNSFTQLVQQIKSADYASANQTFAEIMQQKVADRLATERQSIFTEAAPDYGKNDYRKGQIVTVEPTDKELRSKNPAANWITKPTKVKLGTAVNSYDFTKAGKEISVETMDGHKRSIYAFNIVS